MKDFKINYYDKEKQVVASQNISMSTQEIDAHKVIFQNAQNVDAFLIDTEKKELVLNNTDGSFDDLSTDKPTATIKIDNIKIDYENNLTFSMDSSNKTYRISGGVIEQKQGAKFVPVVTFAEPFNIILPSTLFADIENNNLQTNGLPYQMFEALQDTTPNVEVFESKNKLLHLVKSGNQLYVGRGHKLMPISKDNQNYYKMGDKSVLGFTVGKSNGISGKQSSGIAFNMDEEELDQVAKFINNDTPVEFKTENDYNNNDIDYTRVNKQSDISKKEKVASAKKADNVLGEDTTNLVANPINAPTNEQNDDNNQGEKTINSTPNNSSNLGTPVNNAPENKPDEKKEEEKKEENTKPEEKKPENKPVPPPPKKDEAKINIAGMATVTAFFLAMMIISGLFVSALAFWIFGALAGIATFSDAVITIDYVVNKKPKLTKKEKLEKKIVHKEVELSKLKEKTRTRRIESKIQKAEKYIEKKQDKLNLLNQKETAKKTTSLNIIDNNQEVKEAPNTSVQESLPENQNANDDLNTQDTKAHNNSDNFLGNEFADKKSENMVIKPTKENINKSCAEVRKMIFGRLNTPQELKKPFDSFASEVNTKLEEICPDGLSVDNVPEEERDVFQQMINFRNAYNVATFTKNDTNQSELLDNNETNAQTLNATQKNLRDAMNDLYNSTEDYLRKCKEKEEAENKAKADADATSKQNNNESTALVEIDRQP